MERLGRDLQDTSHPIKVRSLGRTITRWTEMITAWHRGKVTNGPTEAANDLIKRTKRIVLGFNGYATTGSGSPLRRET